jgi:hypothetical protein
VKTVNVRTYPFAGTGELIGHELSSHPVSYAFIRRTRLIECIEFPPFEGQRSCIGVVVSSLGRELPNGFYRITLQDGQFRRVERRGREWYILAVSSSQEKT